MRALYAELLRLRRSTIVPRLDGARALGAEVIGPRAVVARWAMGDGSLLTVASNLGNEPEAFAQPRPGELIFSSSPGDVMGWLLRCFDNGVSGARPVKEASVRALARRAGVDSDWTDAAGRPQRVDLDALVRVLGALGFPCSTAAEARDSRDRLLAREDSGRLPPLVTAESDRAFRLPSAGIVGDVVAELVQEDGVAAR